MEIVIEWSQYVWKNIVHQTLSLIFSNGSAYLNKFESRFWNMGVLLIDIFGMKRFRAITVDLKLAEA